MNNLKSCLFCGNKDHFEIYPDNIVYRGVIFTDWIIECQKCYANGPLKATKEKAIEAWNTRINKEKP